MKRLAILLICIFSFATVFGQNAEEKARLEKVLGAALRDDFLLVAA